MLPDNTSHNLPAIIYNADEFSLIVHTTLSTVGHNSGRIYEQTFNSWRDWCIQHGHNPMNVNGMLAHEYLKSLKVTQATRQRQLSALRKIARIMALDYTNPARQAAYESMTLVKAPTDGASTFERSKHALNPVQVSRVLKVWQDSDLVSLRNSFIISLMFFTGARRSEIAVLEWSDLDLDNGVMTIRHGKGNKYGQIAIAGDSTIIKGFKWLECMPDEETRRYVFPPIVKGNSIGQDKPISANTIYTIVKITELRSGEVFSPHDARRTMITEALVNGLPIAEVQAQARHANASTTLRYAQTSNARSRRKQMRLRYEDDTN